MIASGKGAGLADPVQPHIQGPVLPGDKGTDLILPVHNQAGGHALDPTGGKTPADLLPQQRRKLIAHDPVQNPAGLLGVHQVIVDIPGMGNGFPNHLLGDLVEGHPAGLFIGQIQKLLQVPGDGFALPVRVRCQIHGIRIGRRFFQFLDQILFSGHGNVLGGKVVFQIYAHGALGQIPQMAHTGLHGIVRSQISSDGLSLGRRLYDHKVGWSCHELPPFQNFLRATRFPGLRSTIPLISSMVSAESTPPAGSVHCAIKSSTGSSP